MRLVIRLLTILLCLCSLTANAKQSTYTIVIDPGHGGKDTGAIGKYGVREKDVVLAIAKKNRAEIKKNSRCESGTDAFA